MSTLKKVCIVNYGSGNTRSVFNIFKDIEPSTILTSEEKDIRAATHLVLPGVGAFGPVAEKIRALPVFNALQDEVLNKKKLFLGICVGMQLLADQGFEHGVHAGFGWIPGQVKKLDSKGLSLPHVGWNNFSEVQDNSLLKGIGTSMDFYFVHSYAFEAKDQTHVIASSEYGSKFTAVINKENIYGVQFHPEKSQKAGKILLENFLKLT